MSEFHDRPFPRGVLIAVASLIGFTILAIAVARLSGFDPSQGPRPAEVAGRDLLFIEIGQGELAVHDAASGSLLETLPAGEDGFIRGVLRTLARERRIHDVEPDAPFRLSLREDGHVTLEDRTTDFFVDLKAFGATNEAAFGRFLSPLPAVQ
ncbi:MAG: phosphonoacetaldehyde hydrolase [Thiocapsa sp.]|nr:photosynthetic complex assembly protein PuhC [Thiocapsa sp.]MCG6897627.1 phosphonoacetaldehyde hydrolase [Thiocapsa sp.]MCG6984657.1 phosphonoacetaldehyde hydrolase [Thiocapsa sp.]